MANLSSNIVLSFQHSIKTKRYTIDEKLNEKGKCNEIVKDLFKKFQDISNSTWQELQNKPKKSGYETIPISNFKISLDIIKESLNLSDDSKIIVFRFHRQDYRILGVQKNNILYIIGYDWDFSSYNHGN